MKKTVLFTALLPFWMAAAAQQEDTYGVTLPDADELHILSTEEKVPEGSNSSYERIVLDRKVEAGEYTLVVFPALLDGYYFGPGAERYKVTSCDLTTTPVILRREKMADLDDFQPNQMYLVRSTGDLDQIISMSPGVSTKVPKSGTTLICLTLDDFQDPTGINCIKSTDINDAQTIYNISGRLSKSVKSGIYIINSKKVFEK